MLLYRIHMCVGSELYLQSRLHLRIFRHFGNRCHEADALLLVPLKRLQDCSRSHSVFLSTLSNLNCCRRFSCRGTLVHTCAAGTTQVQRRSGRRLLWWFRQGGWSLSKRTGQTTVRHSPSWPIGHVWLNGGNWQGLSGMPIHKLWCCRAWVSRG